MPSPPTPRPPRWERDCPRNARPCARGRSGLRRNDFGAEPRLDCWIGRVHGLEQAPLPATLADWESRNHRLTARVRCTRDGFIEATRAAVARHGATRVAVLMGTSTSSIGETETAYAQQQDGRFPEALARLLVHAPHALGDFVALATGARGPCMTVATACSSSAKVFALAARMLQAGIADAAVVGGVDTLCGSVLYGFNSLQLVSPEPCRPFDARRRGLSLGEAGGFALLEREPATAARAWLCGYGESSDAHHMSAPHPQGLGARQAMADALARAGLEPAAIGYLNLHGTATPANDAVEAQAVAAMFPIRCMPVQPRAGPGTRSARPGSSNRYSRCSRWRKACCRARSTARSAIRRAGRSCALRRCSSRSATR